jgi:hypothetical protein
LWLYQQKSILQQAVNTNQKQFGDTVVSYAEDQQWTISSNPASPYGLVYGRDAYVEVADRLKWAATWETVRPTLGWDSPAALEEAIAESAIQEDKEDEYSTARGLLGIYESEYERLTEKVATLQKDLESKEETIQEQSQKLTSVRSELEKKNQEQSEQYSQRIARMRDQYGDMEGLYEEARKDLKEARASRRQAEKEWEQAREKLENQIEEWKEAYRQATRGEEEKEVLEPSGKLLRIERSHEFVILEGGKDVGREAGEEYVAYEQSPSGEWVRKGRVVISEVYEKTSMAVISNQLKRLMEGDLFVKSEVWNAFFGAEEAEMAAPGPGEEAGEAAVEEEAPAEGIAEEVQPPADGEGEEAPSIPEDRGEEEEDDELDYSF